MTKPRDKSIDALKGLAITLVVIGHAIQKNIQDPNNNYVYQLIYSFHMPLFMFLSGYTTIISGQIIEWQMINKRARTLVVPFISWFILDSLFKMATTKQTSFLYHCRRLVESPDYGLWFLWTLFSIYCVYVFAEQVACFWNHKSTKMGDNQFGRNSRPPQTSQNLRTVKQHLLRFGKSNGLSSHSSSLVSTC
jgi:fucose 4-O-acetylase-like acetyltransferase